MAAHANGIGANTGVFSVVNALLLRSLPFHDPGRLAYLRHFYEPHESARQFHDWRRRSAWLSDAAIFETREANLGGAGEWRRAMVAQVSSNFFSMLGTQPLLGRGFAAGEDVDAPAWGTPGRNWVVVIGYGLWQELFAGDPKVLGATLRVDGNPMTVIGVAPPGFDYPSKAALWKPGAYSEGNHGWETVARLKPGVTWPQARQAAAAEGNWPNTDARQRMKFPVTVEPLRDQLAGPARQGSLVLMACVGLILLIACTNVANLLLARTADRAAELSIRSALGASGARISRQLLTECVLLSLAATVAGVFIALGTTAIAAKAQPAALATQAYSLLDGRVLAFAIAAALISALLAGVLPTLYAGRAHSFGARGASDSRGARALRDSLAAAQVMLTIVLLAASISVGRAFVRLMHVDRGFAPAGVVTVNVALNGTSYDTEAQRFVYFQQAIDRVRRLPGVTSASATEFLPIYSKGFTGGRFRLEGRPASENSIVVQVFADYFRAMGGRILYGREFTAADLRDNARVAVINAPFAREFGPPAAALGRELQIGRSAWRVVGVVAGMDYMTNGAAGYQFFIPSHAPGGMYSTFVARVNGPAEDHLKRVRDAIQSVDRQVPLFGVKTMEQRLDEALARPQFYRTAVLSLAAFALLLAIIGIYGIVSYTVARRTREMGVRMALGTTPERLRAKLVRQGLVPVLAGAVPGIAGAVLSGRLLAKLVEGAQPVDAVAYAAALLAIGAIAAAGIWAATRPIARLDIVEILRAE